MISIVRNVVGSIDIEVTDEQKHLLATATFTRAEDYMPVLQDMIDRFL